MGLLFGHRIDSRENDLRERIPHIWPSFHENYFQSILGSVSPCEVNSFHCRSRTASDMTCNLVLLSSTSQLIYTWNNLARVTDEEQNGPGLWEFAGESGSDSAKTAYWLSSLHQYTNNQHPIAKKRQLSLPATSTHTSELCYRPVWIQPWTRNEKIGSKWV